MNAANGEGGARCQRDGAVGEDDDGADIALIPLESICDTLFSANARSLVD